MEKIESFKVDHTKLNRGIYVSRKDYDNQTNKVIATTFDVRMKLPNREPVLNIAECHTIEHIGATFLRNHPVWKHETIYFGPMGCRTGCYLLLYGIKEEEAKQVTIECFEKCLELDYVPGTERKQCGNYKEHDLEGAKREIKAYLEVLKK